jgi:IgGFc binding protein
MGQRGHRRGALPRWAVAVPACVLACACSALQATTSSEFWFAPPDVTDLYNLPGGEPLYLVVSSGAAAATVTVEQPANGSFTPIVFSLAPFNRRRVNLSPFKPALETRPTNTVLNTGLHVLATAPVSAVYEVANSANAEEFPLRGADALGTAFTIPLQRYSPFSNFSFASPHQAYASFDIVATQNATQVLMYSPVPLDGHPALQQFAVSLNRGQTYSAGFTGSGYENPFTHPSGAVLLADKPVAITLKDDAVRSVSGGCYDLIGDQLVPERALGREYVAVEGSFLVDESLMIHATRNGTQIFRNGSATPEATLFAGEMYRIDLDYLHAGADDAVHVRASQPVYASQASGVGCELGMALLPPLARGGSRAVDFVRSGAEGFALQLVVPAAALNAFTLNGNPTAINAGGFKDVPGTAGAWKSALLALDTTQVPVDMPMHLENAADRFFAAILRGGVGSDTATFGYRSDFLADIGMEMDLAAAPAQLPEPGAAVTYTVTVSNSGIGPLLLDSLADTQLGSLQGQGCVLPQTIAVGGFYQCSYSSGVSGNAGQSFAATVMAQGQSLGSALDAAATANVGLSDVPPAFTFAAQASALLVGPDGGPLVFAFGLTNTAVEPLLLQELRRDGSSLDGEGDCATGGAPLAPGATYACSAVLNVSGAQGSQQTLHFTAAMGDDEGNAANAAAFVAVTIDTRLFADGFD